MSSATPQAPGALGRSLHEIREDARLVNCPQCWRRPGPACTARGDHLARYQRAERRGLIGREDLAAVIAGLEVIAAHVIIRDGAR
jgi:hypothetical protein